MGYPINILGKDYARNHLLFNLAFVFHRHDSARVFEPVVRKLAKYLKVLELEHQLVSSPDQRPRVQTIIDKVLVIMCPLYFKGRAG